MFRSPGDSEGKRLFYEGKAVKRIVPDDRVRIWPLAFPQGVEFIVHAQQRAGDGFHPGR
jgi:hypothetical protein